MLGALLLSAWTPPALEAQDEFRQTYEVSVRREADAETQAFPARLSAALVLPDGISAPRVCVITRASAEGDWRTRVRALVTRVDDAGKELLIDDLVFEWRESDLPFRTHRCLSTASLLAGDVVEFRFRFFETPPLRLLRDGRRIATLPVVEVVGTVETDPQAG